MASPALAQFHPLVAEWFTQTLGEPTAPQNEGWAHTAAGRDTLIAAPTGSGKTLAAFLWAINQLVEAAASGTLEDRTSVVYISPLKALSNDVQKNLAGPLSAIQRLAAAGGTPLPEISVAVRTGDTPSAERARMLRRPPHILITTPESLAILLTAKGSREFLRTTRAVIVDEIHAVAGDKRGAHLALSLERLERLAERRPQRIGLSATQKPIRDIAALLTGRGASRPCGIVDVGHQRRWDLAVEVPTVPLGPIAGNEASAEVYDRIAQLAGEHRSTLVFVNTRRLVERVSHQLSTRLGEGRVAAHHGSLSRATRLEAERGLKSGEIRVVVATASLELGIDIGHVDLVCHLGAPRSLATLVQRIGRSGHWVAGTPRGIIFALTRDELLQCAAAVRAVRSGELDEVVMPPAPLDILAQQIVALVASEDAVGEEDLWRLVQRAHPYRDLARQDFDRVVTMLSDGVATRRGRRGAHLHRDQVNGVLRGRRGALLTAITSGGAIPDTADYDVVEDPAGTLVGKLNEDFAIESMAGDIFLLGNASWRIRRVEAGRVRVEDAHGAPPTIPFWLGESPGRTRELSDAVSRLREDIASRILSDSPGAACEWLMAETAVDAAAAEQLVGYISDTRAVLGCIPSKTRVVAERFFDEAGGMQLVLHAPFGARINRAWGLALRKRFCVTFDFELQAAATDDGVLLSLGEQHSFPLDSVFAYLNSATVEDVLIQALLPSPMFTNRWRWNAGRSLALPRHSGGRRVPMPIQRMRAEDLLGAVFPDQMACQENRSGPLEVPDHPLVDETVRDCLHEAMDVEGLRDVIRAIEEGRLETIAVETAAPSAMCHEILNSNPYAFLDDAPLEERRSRAVSLRRTDPELARGIGALDPAAIATVRAQAGPDHRNAEELHDHLLTVGLLPDDDAHDWADLLAELVAAGRVTHAAWADGDGHPRRAWVAAERVGIVRSVLADAVLSPPMPLDMGPARSGDGGGGTRAEAVRNILLGWVQSLGPTTAASLAARLGLERSDIDLALLALEGSGVVLRGRFTPAAQAEEWCERGLLARIHRLTVGRLRAEIAPVPAATLMRFLLRWQHVQPESRLHGREGVVEVIGQLQGVEVPAPAWEERILPARVARYDPADLETLCLSGVVTWGRVTAAARAMEADPGAEAPERRVQGPGRSTPIAFLVREQLRNFVSSGTPEEALPPPARAVAAYLVENGASFLADIAAGTGRLPAEVEDALWELVARGRVTGDGVGGLRALLDKGTSRGLSHPRFRALPAPRAGRALPAGRWSLWAPNLDPPTAEERCEMFAGQLLHRWGIVVRELLWRERSAPPWRNLLRVYRRWEAQGQVRGGRFVAGLVGEQFALPEAVEALRAVRRSAPDADPVIVAAADPLNLVGIVLPGSRISPFSSDAIAYRDGVTVDVGPLGMLRSHLGRPAA